MSTTIAVYLQSGQLPDTGQLLAMVHALEPKLAFTEGFDPGSDEGWVPCQIGKDECGFEWELEPVEELPQALVQRGFDHTAVAGYRSSDADAICAVLVAANIALACGGVLEAPVGALIEPGDAGKWAQEQVSALKKSSKARKPRKKKPGPEQLLEAGLAALHDARLTQLVRAFPDDPNVGMRFDRGVGLQGRRWTLIPDGRAPVSTQAMPRELSDADQQVLTEAVGLLMAALQAGPVVSARFDADSLDLTLQLSHATLTLHPQAARNGSTNEMLFGIFNYWKLHIDGDKVYPDVEKGCVLIF